MVYDPSGKSRIVIGVFPRGSPFTATSAFAGVDRISKFPWAALVPERAGGLAVTPAAGRDGVAGGGVDRRPVMKKYASASQTTMTLITRIEKNRRGPFTSWNTGVC